MHKHLDDLPPAVEMMSIEKEQLSNYQLHFKEELQENDSMFTTPRLIADLNPKHNYVIHSRTLKKYIELGVKATKVTKILEFDQAPYFNNYIETLMAFRKSAKRKFESNLYKYLSNSVLSIKRQFSIQIPHY